jgi:hypothetical protein
MTDVSRKGAERTPERRKIREVVVDALMFSYIVPAVLDSSSNQE